MNRLRLILKYLKKLRMKLFTVILYGIMIMPGKAISATFGELRGMDGQFVELFVNLSKTILMQEELMVY